jgi:hypothetical protein
MIRYFEYAVSEGEGLLTEHYVLAITPDSDGDTVVVQPKFDAGLISPDCIELGREITLVQYAEFITIHGSEVAV